MKHLMARILIAALAAVPLFGGYGYVSSVTFAGATGSTQTNITLLFRFGDPNLKTAANGGQIQNLCSRNGTSVPCDFIFTNDSTCTIITGGYKWGFDGDYSATAGTGHGWVMIPSYTTSGVTPTVCIGNSAISTYQGGAVGAEFDSNTILALHLANGTTLSLTDFSSTGNTTTNTNGSIATTGKIDGGVSFAAASQQYLTINAASSAWNPTSFTAEEWFNSTTDLNILRRDDGTTRAWLINLGSGSVSCLLIFGSFPGVTSAAATYADGNWHHAAITVSATGGISTITLYVDGVLQGSASTAGTNPVASSLIRIAGLPNFGSWYSGNADNTVYSTTVRSANWIATEYGNQNSPPAIGQFTGSRGIQVVGTTVGAAVY